ncbi:M56 family metallopeptidase [Polaribacter sp. 11A2H]|uniref:M56 family metallopeptidase n=1 Tax=Polaribacter sp. 11A2H TaxID=2687290 RepID=UPI00140A92D5|nr:M56 family metallopeptidase [Polaribacter sp. 11A2H]
MILYLLKSASCLALLLFFYHFILEKEKMHTFNRFYLLIGIIVSFLVPLATITVQSKNILETNGEPIFMGNTAFATVHETFNYSQLLIGVYLMISILFLIRFVKNFAKIIQKIRKNETIKYQKGVLVLVEEEILPHTFWNFIFINKKDYKEGKIEEELFTHELTHVTQKHTLDVLIIELLQIIFWVNPLFIFLKKAIQLNHEFLADEKVINQHKNTNKYQHLLLNKAAWNNEYYLASNLNYSLTKKRLKMMTKQSSQTKILLKQLSVIPLLVGFLFLFAERVQAQEKAKDKIVIEYNSLAKKVKSKDNAVTKKEDIEKLEKLYVQLSESQKKTAAPFPFTSIKEKNKEEPIFYLNGEVTSKKEVDKINADNIESVNVTKKENGSSTVSIKKKKEPIYYLDGKRISKKEMKEVKPDTIESVNVEKNKDGGGSIYITSKKE